MKKAILIAVCLAFMFSVSGAQEKKEKELEYKLTSEKLDQQGKDLDVQIAALSKKMGDIIKKYDMLKASGVRVLPYQTNYILGPDYIEIEKHSFIKEEIYERDITGLETRKIKIYANGQNVTRIESEIYERNYWSSIWNIVRIVDPSPMTEGTDDVTFTHIMNGKEFVENKRLGDIKNTTAFPIRNDIKREFLIPHLSYFMNSLLFIAEAYYKGLKDAEASMNDFLKKSKNY
ncbi:MAG: hypothetical protein A2176_08390 [Spirochaetes bacterium RBG_13_51_14]|nr:MAG: hypothetical protein A2176_08390 [Spirochaetes bacterium RBG_13_51_14]